MSDISRTNFGMLYNVEDTTEMIDARRISARLQHTYFRQRLRIPDLNMLMDAVELAKKVKLDKEETWNYIRNSPYVYGQNLAFIEDTIDFIFSDRRNVSIDNWLQLVDYEDNKQSPVKKDFLKYKKMKGKDKTDIITLWVKKPNGLADMVMSLYILLYETERVNN